MMRLPLPALSILAAASLLAISGCAAVSVDDPPAVPIAPVPTAQPAPAPRRAPVNLVFEQVEGAEAARTRAVFAPAPARVAACGASKGVVQLRLVSRDGKAHYSVEPSTTLDGQARRCVLETLSTIDLEGLSGDANPAARPSGFSVLFRLEW
ncbi:MAG: hypothetical protein QM820_03885 [Minicystis sp.]